MNNKSENSLSKTNSNFIRNIIEEDIQNNQNAGQVVTRFPPEPNGFLHIGHAKSICINFGLAKDYNGRCHLRFDDTNPAKEEAEYVKSIKNDLTWLGFKWEKHLYFASDYFEKMYELAICLIKNNGAYVDDLTGDEIRAHRGTLTQPGKESPYRNRSIKENLDLFNRMRQGEFLDGTKVLRAKIDMASPNMNMRDPVMYRILRATHHRTGDTWCVYPMYDWAHGLEDSIEGITHSICTLEFEDHRPLYDFFLKELNLHHPKQIEFARLNLNYTVMSKRKLLELVQNKHVEGWDDPRLPTLSGLRRRGYTPDSIKNFCERIGVGKKDTVIDMGILEDCVREDLNEKAKRIMCVLNPIKVVITNYPKGQVKQLDASCHPKNPQMGRRNIPFSSVIYIDQNDFMEDPPKKFFRLAPGKTVRLRYAYVIKCEKVIKDDKTGKVLELQCTYDPQTIGGKTPEGQKKVKGIIHWVSVDHAVTAKVRLYDRLFNKENPTGSDTDYTTYLNPESLKVIPKAFLEPAILDATGNESYQFERVGYFCFDSKDSLKDNLVFHRIVTLRDSWAKLK